MIRLHHYNHDAEAFWLNPDLIESIDLRPTTVLTLTTGKKVWVKEAPEEVCDLAALFRGAVLHVALNMTSERAGEILSARATAADLEREAQLAESKENDQP